MKRGTGYEVRGAGLRLGENPMCPMSRVPYRFCLLLVLLLIAAVPVKAAVFYPETFTLSNGLQVVVVENCLSPAVNQMVWYKAGSADEPAGRSGLAHYLEHLMFRGTKDIAPGRFSRIIAEQGGNDNAFTSHDYTAYYETVAADRLGLIMQLEADRMANLALTPEVAAPELGVVLKERQERYDNKPRGLFQEKLRQLLFPEHPYGIPVIGIQDEMEKMTAASAEDFYRHYYAPNNAVVVISGNVHLDEVMRLAAGTYGRLPARDVPPRKVFPKVERPSETRFVMKDARVKQPHVEMHVVAPSYSTARGNEAYALEVLSEVLDSGEVGVLYKDLVVRQKVASALSVSYDPQRRGPSPFVIIGAPQPGRTAAELDGVLHDSLRRLAREGVSARAVAEAKGRLAREAVFARDSLTAPGNVFGQALVTGQKVQDIEAWPDRIRAVTPADVNKALRDVVTNPYRVTGMLLPDAEATPEERTGAVSFVPEADGAVR